MVSTDSSQALKSEPSAAQFLSRVVLALNWVLKLGRLSTNCEHMASVNRQMQQYAHTAAGSDESKACIDNLLGDQTLPTNVPMPQFV